MAMFLVLLRRTGPQWLASRPLEDQSRWVEHAEYMDELVAKGVIVLGGPLDDDERVVLAVAGDSEAAVRAALAGDPWSESHLQIDTVEHWTIRLGKA
jgi:uncharacterized protein YciI